MAKMRNEMKFSFEEAKRLKKWQIVLSASGVTTNRDFGFGEADMSATFKGKKHPNLPPESKY